MVFTILHFLGTS